MDLNKINPTEDRVLVKMKEAEKVTKSGIIIPDTHSADKPQIGEVVAVGPGKRMESGERMTMTIKVGDTVLFSKYGPTEVKIDNEEIFFLREDDVIAVVG